MCQDWEVEDSSCGSQTALGLFVEVCDGGNLLQSSEGQSQLGLWQMQCWEHRETPQSSPGLAQRVLELLRESKALTLRGLGVPG